MSLPQSPPDASLPGQQETPERHMRGKDKAPRKKRKTITPEIVRLVVEQARREKRPSNKEIAANVGISYQTLLNLLKKINNGELDCEDGVLYVPEKKGRKPIITKAKIARTKELLTATPMAEGWRAVFSMCTPMTEYLPPMP